MGGRPIATAGAVVIGASLFGLLLPVAFGGVQNPAIALLWLALALGAGVCLVWAARPIAAALGALLARLVARTDRSSWSPRVANDLARLLVAAGYIVVLQAILRRPLVAVFGAEADPFVIEAVTGMLALLIVLALLSWIYAVARPLLEGVATSMLDATIATAPAAESSTVLAATPGGNGAAATVLAPQARGAEAAATVVSARRSLAADEATQLASDAAATIRVEPPSDATEVSG